MTSRNGDRKIKQPIRTLSASPTRMRKEGNPRKQLTLNILIKSRNDDRKIMQPIRTLSASPTRIREGRNPRKLLTLTPF